MGFLHRFINFDPAGEEEGQKSFSDMKDGLYRKLFVEKDKTKLIGKLGGDLNRDIRFLKEHVLNYNKKLESINSLMASKDSPNLKKLEEEIKKTLKLVKDEKGDEDKESSYVLKALEDIRSLDEQVYPKVASEELQSIKDSINRLRADIESLEPCIAFQLSFLDKEPEAQLRSLDKLIAAVKKEGQVLGIEESMLSQLQEHIENLQVEMIMS